MRLRVGVIVTGLITLGIGALLLYSSLLISPNRAFESVVLGMGGIVLVALSVGTMRGRTIALSFLAVFYIALSIIGLLLTLGTPPEGMLIFFFSLVTGLYLLRARRMPYVVEDGMIRDHLTGPNSEDVVSREESINIGSDGSRID